MKICIIGGGPVGLTLALFLKKMKIPYKLFEKNKTLQSKIKISSSSSFYPKSINGNIR